MHGDQLHAYLSSPLQDVNNELLRIVANMTKSKANSHSAVSEWASLDEMLQLLKCPGVHCARFVHCELWYPGFDSRHQTICKYGADTGVCSCHDRTGAYDSQLTH